jgi:hypothetical protein
MKHILLITIVLAMYADAFGQGESPLSLDSLHVTHRNPDVNDDSPVSVNDAAYESRTVELNVLFHIGNIAELDVIELRYGTSPGLPNLIEANFKMVVTDSLSYLKFGNTILPVIDQKVYFTQLLPERYVRRQPAYIWIRAKDTQGRYSNILTDNN